MAKRLILGLLGFIIIGAILVKFVAVNLDEKVGEEVTVSLQELLGVEASIGVSDVSLSKGTVNFQQLVIPNPQNFSSTNAIVCPTLFASLNKKSLGTNTLEINEIIIESPTIRLERFGQSSNLKSLGSNAREKRNAEDTADNPEINPRIMINKVRMNNPVLILDLARDNENIEPIKIPLNESFVFQDLQREADGPSVDAQRPVPTAANSLQGWLEGLDRRTRQTALRHAPEELISKLQAEGLSLREQLGIDALEAAIAQREQEEFNNPTQPPGTSQGPQTIRERIENAGDKAKELGEKALEKGGEIKEVVSEKAGEISKEVGEKAGEIKEKVSEKAGELGEAVKEKTKDLREDLKDNSKDLGEKLKEKGEELGKNLSEGTEKTKEVIKEKAEDVGEKIDEIKKDVMADDDKTTQPQNHNDNTQ